MMFMLAWRNVRRNLGRSVLSLVAVVVGTLSLVVGRAFLSGMEENMIRSQIDAVSGHVELRPKDYPEEKLMHPVDALFPVDPALATWLDGHTEAWAPRLVFAPTAIHLADSMRVRAIGFDPVKDPVVFPRTSWKVTGAVPETAEQGVLVAAGIAQLLHLQPGDAITFQVRTAAGAINALQVPVAGLVAAGNPWVDGFVVFMPMSLADELVQAHGTVSHVATRLDMRAPDVVDAFATALSAQAGPQRETATWMAETAELLALQEVRGRALDLLVFVLMGMSATGIANTVLMAAYERTREIGTLRAMGMTEGGVLRLFLAEGLVLGVTGSTVGCALAAALVSHYASTGIDLSARLAMNGPMSIPVSTMLYVALDARWLTAAWLFGVVVAVGASLLPARVAARMEPAEAVRA